MSSFSTVNECRKSKIVIAGGSGFIGQYISKRFVEDGYEVSIISLQAGNELLLNGKLADMLEGADLLINLAGKSINCHFSAKNKQAILQSRIRSTALLGQALQRCVNPPALWINASAIGIYPAFDGHPVTEGCQTVGNGFLAQVVLDWEKTFFDFEGGRTKQIALRTGVVLGRDGGALHSMLALVRKGLGGSQGSGKQYFSWIHIEDYYRIILFLMNIPVDSRIINACSPMPVHNRELMKKLRSFCHVLIGLPAPAILLRLASPLIGVDPELSLNNQYVVSSRLAELEFKFLFPQIGCALKNLCTVNE